MKTVLLLDTDVQQMKIMKSFLKKYGLDLECCKDLEQMEKYLKTQSIDLLILNSTSPKLNQKLNFETLLKSKLVNKFPSLVISNNDEWKNQGIDENRILNTPINYYHLLEAIENTINEHRKVSLNDMVEKNNLNRKNSRRVKRVKKLMASSN